MVDPVSIFMPVVSQNFGYVALILAFVLIAKLSRTATFKGFFGEWLVRIALRIYFPPKKGFRHFHDITIPTEDGTTQIDHVLVSRYGIFVIETKNMKGWIYGYVGDENWTQKIFKFSCKFQNPLRQNYKHTKSLGQHLSVGEEALESVVVFIGASEFKNQMPSNVVYRLGLIDYIEGFTEKVLSTAQAKQTIIGMKCLQRGSESLAKGYVAHLKEKHQAASTDLER